MDAVVKLLPPGPPREKFIALRDMAADRVAISRAGVDEMEDARTAVNKAEIALTLYLRNPRQTIEAVARLEGQIAEAKAEMARIAVSRDARWARSQPIGTLVNRIVDYVTNTDPRSISVFDGAMPKRKGTPAEAVAAARQEIEELTARLAGIDNAPFPTGEIKARLNSIVKGLAEGGAPEIDGVMAGGVDILWPTTLMLAGANALAVPDAVSLLAWLFPDQVSKKLSAMIDEEAADDATAISAKDRPKMAAQIHDALLLANRAEEAAIMEAAATGAEIDRRGEADVRAVLGIVGPRARDEI